MVLLAHMIKLTSGNLLESNAEALVNTVNCDGYMGKGIALQFKQAFPLNYKAYHRACKKNEVLPGKMFIFETQCLENPKYIINFPTKRHWKSKSRIEDIKSGLSALISDLQQYKIRSIAIPPLGCGLGGLNWNDVYPLIKQAFAEAPEIEVLLFPPLGSPTPKTMIVRTVKKMTIARALFIQLMKSYKAFDYCLSLLEIQKLAYFLQEAGQPLRLQFEKHRYGPYAHNLNKVLEAMESHYTSGFGDQQTSRTEIELLPGAPEEAEVFLRNELNDIEALNRLERVSKLIEGFETPYSIELLATVHWLANKEAVPVRTAEEAVQGVHNWNDRKKATYPAKHIQIAWDHLVSQGWIEVVATKAP